jgi:hypothetical protein
MNSQESCIQNGLEKKSGFETPVASLIEMIEHQKQHEKSY